MLEQMYNFYSKLAQNPVFAPNTSLVMKLIMIILMASIFQVTAKTYAQKITLSEKNTPLNKVFEKISDQTGFDFLVSTENLMRAKTVTINVQNEELRSVLDKIFITQPLSFVIQEKMVVVSSKGETNPNKGKSALKIQISGKVVDEEGTPIPGATLRISDVAGGNITDRNGAFTYTNAPEKGILSVSFIGYLTSVISYDNAHPVPALIVLRTNKGTLDEIQIVGYGETTRRLGTGSTGKLNQQDIASQPVSNPLSALEGHIPGLLITQSSGMNGAGFKIQLRGQGSLVQGSDPYFIVDGVPFSTGNSPLNQIANAAGSGASGNDGLSPFDLINPGDIESIDVLKDADATAIYGSRGANGVILITTKKGKAGKTIVSGNLYSGASRITRTMDMLNTQQYVQMRKEAFKNDGLIPNATNAPDLILWDTTRYTDFKKLLIGNTARTTDAQLSISGGETNTRFLIGAGYHRQTTVFPTDQSDQRGSVHISLDHTSPDKKFMVSFSTIYAANTNNMTAKDLTGLIITTPNLKLYDNEGKLNWQEGGISYYNLGLNTSNPLAFTEQSYTGQFQNLNANLKLSYKVLKDFDLKVSFGYNTVNSNESGLNPSSSIDPNMSLQPYSYFGNQNQKSWIIEPQVEYLRQMGPSKLNVLIGNTWQSNSSFGSTATGSNYTSDLLLGSLAAAGTTQTTNTSTLYRYSGLYGRIGYNYKEKYLLNLSARRDGSSRFGPADRFNNFGAIGAAWIFSEEKLIKEKVPFLSFGKIRGSYGITGNDQIGNYKYLDTWAPGNTTYQGLSVLNPSALYNPVYTWERNKKSEIGVDLGFFKDRVLITGDYFRNRSDNQLVNYLLPTQTGFATILKNLDAQLENTGWEFQITTKNIASSRFNWSTTLNLTVPYNKLLDFPGLATSSYAATYIIGQSVSTRRAYHALGVDPATGVYQFEDADHNGSLTTTDKIALTNPDPKFYGGLQNYITFMGFDLSVFFEFRKQNGNNYLTSIAAPAPGYNYSNQPVIVLTRWQKPGDITTIQRFTSTENAALTASGLYVKSSDALFSDASFIRCRNVSLAYHIPVKWLDRMKFSNCRVYLQGENLFTITRYIGADPENQNLFVLPPLQTLTAGIQLTF